MRFELKHKKTLIVDEDTFTYDGVTYNISDIEGLELVPKRRFVVGHLEISIPYKPYLIDAYFMDSESEKQKAEEIYKYIREKTSAKTNEETLNTEYRKKCNVCGEVWMYTGHDLHRNDVNRGNAKLAKIGGVISVIGGTTADQHMMYDMKQRSENQIIDYDRCPSCKSTDISDISEEEFKAIKQKGAVQNTVSAADEILKYHELLEKGIITQEEFDAKKKQLLGL